MYNCALKYEIAIAIVSMNFACVLVGMKMAHLADDGRPVVLFHAERFRITKVQNHSDRSGSEAKHQAPERSLRIQGYILVAS
jgi:hypothetical protein